MKESLIGFRKSDILYYMYLVVGLGNPGKKYDKTRHNIGFLALDTFVKEHGFSEFTLSKKHTALVAEGNLNQIKVALAKPQTFMNNSGKAVKSLVTKYNIPKSDLVTLIIIHDDIDIPLGKIKISKNRGSAGHKGVDSIIQALGTKNFTRVRIGIQPQGGKPRNVEMFVLKPFSKTELTLLQSAIQHATESLFSLVSPKNS